MHCDFNTNSRRISKCEFCQWCEVPISSAIQCPPCTWSNTLREGYDLAWQLRFSSEGFNPAEDSVVNLLNRTKRASWVSIRLCLLLYHSVVTFYAYYKLLPIKWTSIISGNVSLLKPSFQQWNVLTSDSPTLQRSKDTNRSLTDVQSSHKTKNPASSMRGTRRDCGTYVWVIFAVLL